MNIFLHELKAYRKSMVIWTAVMIAVALLYLTIYPSFTKDMSQVNKMLMGYPKPIREALGLSMGTFSTLIGFYGFLLTFVVLCGAIQAMNLGTSILSKEIREKTADFLMTKPVTRTTIMTAKLLGAVVVLVISNLLYLVIIFGYSKIITNESFSTKQFFLMTLSLFLVQLMFMSLGVIISVIARKIRSVISVSLGTVFGFFIISMLGSVIGEQTVRYITPFKYYDPSYIVKHSSYEARFVIIEAIFIIVSIILSYVIYTKKDIHAV